MAGVCTGLEAAGRGSTGGWRLLFLISSICLGFPIFVYAALALSWPEVKTKEEAQAKAKAGTTDSETVPGLTGIEANLSKLVAMKEKGLITEDEFAKMRKKELGID